MLGGVDIPCFIVLSVGGSAAAEQPRTTSYAKYISFLLNYLASKSGGETMKAIISSYDMYTNNIASAFGTLKKIDLVRCWICTNQCTKATPRPSTTHAIASTSTISC